MVDYYSPITREDYLIAYENDVLLTQHIPVMGNNGRQKRDKYGLVFEEICFPSKYYPAVLEMPIEKRLLILEAQSLLIGFGRLPPPPTSVDFVNPQKGVGGWFGYDPDYGPLFVGTPFEIESDKLNEPKQRRKRKARTKPDIENPSSKAVKSDMMPDEHPDALDIDISDFGVADQGKAHETQERNKAKQRDQVFRNLSEAYLYDDKIRTEQYKTSRQKKKEKMAKLLLKRYQSLYIFCSNCGERSLVEVYSDRPFWYIGPKYCFEIPDKWRCSKCETEETFDMYVLCTTLLVHPLTPTNPVVFFDYQVLRSFNQLRFSCEVSLRPESFLQTFFEGLQETNGCNKVPHIKPRDFAQSAFVFHCIELGGGTFNSLKWEYGNYNRGLFQDACLERCPACDDRNPILLSDGNYKLDHFVSRGKTQSKVKTKFFGSESAKSRGILNIWTLCEESNQRIENDKEEVDSHGASIRAMAVKYGNKTEYDVKGVVGIRCIHGYVYGLKDMTGYEVFDDHLKLLEDVAKKYFDPNAKIVFSCDTGCKMQKQLDENYPDLARRTRLAIPTFHAIGHGLECRKFSMRYTKGVGIHAGESIESMWAKLNKLGAQLRYMSLPWRHDFIEANVIKLNRRVEENIPKFLFQMFQRSIDLEKEQDKVIAQYSAHSSNEIDFDELFTVANPKKKSAPRLKKEAKPQSLRKLSWKAKLELLDQLVRTAGRYYFLCRGIVAKSSSSQSVLKKVIAVQKDAKKKLTGCINDVNAAFDIHLEAKNIDESNVMDCLVIPLTKICQEKGLKMTAENLINTLRLKEAQEIKKRCNETRDMCRNDLKRFLCAMEALHQLCQSTSGFPFLPKYQYYVLNSLLEIAKGNLEKMNNFFHNNK